MKILKFGGTSVGSADRIQSLLDIVNPSERQIVVLSAVAGTTNTLEEISSAFLNGKKDEAKGRIIRLKEQYGSLVKELFKTESGQKQGKELIDYHFNLIASLSNDLFTPTEEKIILAQGELLSTTLWHFHLREKGISSVLLPALEFMKIDEDNEPVIPFIKEKVETLLQETPDNTLYITQGYICRNAFGEIDNLRRGGSDYTASLIGSAIQADEIQIWTDIDGMHNNDPRIVSTTTPIAELSFDEAAELAYFGAKILHPQSVFPAQKYKVPVRLLNTLDPHAHGTLISENGGPNGTIRAIAAKDGITAIHIHSSRMLLAYGFLRRIFEIFERYKTPIDMITTSEVAVSLTVDDTRNLDDIIREVEDFGRVSVDRDQTIVCVVGDFSANRHGYAARVLDAIKHLPIRMVSYGGSDYNVSVLLDRLYKTEALRSLHNRIF